jgi:hypothetical protein
MINDTPEDGTVGIVNPVSLTMTYSNGKWCSSGIVAGGTSNTVTIKHILNETDTVASLTPEDACFYEFTQPLTSLDIITLPAVTEQCAIKFTTADTCDIYFPEDAKFFGAMPVFNVNTTYLLTIGFGWVGVGIAAEG